MELPALARASPRRLPPSFLNEDVASPVAVDVTCAEAVFGHACLTIVLNASPSPWAITSSGCEPKPEKRPEIIEAWTEGRTGFPIVDAGMRQLAATGWMHNRLRMITASFLAKILLVDWRVGERVFMQRLVDGDPAANNGGWQWSASTGTDATPYFRIFNPLLQSRKFDPDGTYLRRWIPELSEVPAPLIHEPGREPGLLERTGYPPPCVDYAERRQEALALLGAAGSAGPAPTRKPRRKTTGRRRS